ncbi:MAG: hypothetical protein Q8920_13530 [Bacillota bacterium]|nr:hypothetical protein [Bacillota bacterium]
MKRKSIAIISILLGISVITAAAIISYNKLGISSLLSLSKNKTDSTANVSGKTADSKVPADQTKADASATIEKTEIPVDNNSLEYDLKVNIHENGKKQTFLAFEYYNDNNDVLREFDDKQLPEIMEIFEKSKDLTDDSKGYRVKSVHLDRKYSKAYVVIEGAVEGGSVETSIYSYSLTNLTINRIFSGKGSFTDPGFSKDESYMAFSLSSDSPSKNTCLYILKCENDEFVVSQNKTKAGQPIGKPKTAAQAEYGFISWYANTIAKLRQISGNSSGSGNSGDVLYDIVNDIFLNPDGSLPSTVNGASGQNIKESDSVKVLRSFYSNLSTGQYDKAYDLLDNRFTLNAFKKQFGTIELDKADIGISDFQTYGMFFSSGRIRNIVKEKVTGNTSTIYYYQVVSLEQGDQEQAIVATLKKTSKGWKVSMLDEGNDQETPFKK